MHIYYFVKSMNFTVHITVIPELPTSELSQVQHRVWAQYEGPVVAQGRLWGHIIGRGFNRSVGGADILLFHCNLSLSPKTNSQ